MSRFSRFTAAFLAAAFVATAARAETDVAPPPGNSTAVKRSKEWTPPATGPVFAAREALEAALLLESLGRADFAVRALERAPGPLRNDPEVAFTLARLRLLAGRPRAARVLLRHLVSSRRGGEAWFFLGLCHEALGRPELARRAYSQAIRRDPNDPLSHRFLARILRDRGNLGEATSHLEEALRLDPNAAEAERELASLRGHRPERKKTVSAKRAEPILAIPLEPQPMGPVVRVGLIDGLDSIEFVSSRPFTLREVVGKTDSLPAGRSFRILVERDGMLAFYAGGAEPYARASSFSIEPSTPDGALTLRSLSVDRGQFWATREDRSYRGALEFRLGEKGMTIVNHLPIEPYLYAVVPSEMSSSWPSEALKAQAIAARTEALRKRGRHEKQGFDFCADVHCQAYRGLGRESGASRAAVDVTKGLALMHEGRPIDAIYSSNCGGHTQDNVFGDRTPIPYLKGRPDSIGAPAGQFPMSPAELERWLKNPPAESLCNQPKLAPASHFRWARSLTSEDLERTIARPELGAVRDIVVQKREPSGHVTEIEVVCENGTLSLGSELSIRNALGGLRSSLFKVEIQRNAEGDAERFFFRGGGWGHGVGLCQTGAAGLALRGASFRTILRHYFGKDASLRAEWGEGEPASA